MALLRYRTPWPPSRCRATSTRAPPCVAARAIEVTRLLRLLGVGADVLQGHGRRAAGRGRAQVFIALWNAVRERRADIAMLRMLGAPGRVLVCCCARRCGWRCWRAAWACCWSRSLAESAGRVLLAQGLLP